MPRNIAITHSRRRPECDRKMSLLTTRLATSRWPAVAPSEPAADRPVGCGTRPATHDLRPRVARRRSLLRRHGAAVRIGSRRDRPPANRVDPRDRYRGAPAPGVAPSPHGTDTWKRPIAPRCVLRYVPPPVPPAVRSPATGL